MNRNLRNACAIVSYTVLVLVLPGCGKANREADLVSERPYVFFGINGNADCEIALEKLAMGNYELSPSGSKIGWNTDWGDAGRTPYEMFNLNTLRHLECLVAASFAERNGDGLARAVEEFRDWATANSPGDARRPWAWLEHPTAWRAIILAHMKRADDDLSTMSTVDREWLANLASEHADQLSKESIYTPDHNHGLNNALGLMALGTAFNSLPDAQDWRQTAWRRAEQQMSDNVSDDGIHLEQSGFYHYYTLRTFLELARVSEYWQIPMTPAFFDRLDRMLHAAARMADRNGTLGGMPYTAPDRDLLRSFLPRTKHMPPGSGRNEIEAARAGNQTQDLAVYPHGGFSFWPALDSDSIRVIMHHRILDAPHAHQDAMGISASIGDYPLLLFPSSNSTGQGEWSKYFTGPLAHNTVYVEGMKQEPLSKRREGFLARFFDSYKVNAALSKVRLDDNFQSIRRKTEYDWLPLTERSDASGGEIIASGESDGIAYVTARHFTYRGIEHIRTVARIDGDILIVWDRLEADQEHTFVQTFHFAPQSTVQLARRKGRLTSARIDATFVQLADSKAESCEGVQLPERCGWFAKDRQTIVPTPALKYRVTGSNAEFLWVLGVGDVDLQAYREDDVVAITMGSRHYRLQLKNSVRLMQAKPKIAAASPTGARD